jgi:chaperonin GroES
MPEIRVRPLGDRVVVRRVEEDQKVGNLYLPDVAKERPMEGMVVEVGRGRLLENGERIPVDVAVGDKVLFGKYSGTEFKAQAEELLVLREDEILAVLE